MRTKTTLLTVALIAAGAVSSMAQVYSLNVVGYVNKTITGSAPGKLTLVANPLNTTNNTIASLFPDVPNGAQLYKFNGVGFDIATFFFGSWDAPATVLAPGEGAFINTDTTFTATFVGEVLQGSLSTPFPAGLSIRSSKVPQNGNADTLNLTPALTDGDQVYKWNFANQSYDIYTLFFGSWSPSVPAVDVGESVFLNAQNAGNWTRTFTVN